MGTNDEQGWDAARAAHRALHGILVEGKRAGQVQDDLDRAGPAFIGVFCAFFRNVMERALTGHESVDTVRSYLNRLKAAHPRELAALQTYPMAVFVLEQIGPGAPPPGESRLFSLEGELLHQMRLAADYTAKQENLVGDVLELYLQGASARYVTGTY
ncbi:hypothetical protein [Kitasatospora sp. KL5]|uniref:hypothetical protein n=1 Tax=Kitasatospora sp. KL5 TaxID=3425125 RepID=UPI003D6E22DF